MGLIQRRQGHWEDSTPNLEHAVDLDPRNRFTLLAIADSYRDLRRYADAESAYDRALAVDPVLSKHRQRARCGIGLESRYPNRCINWWIRFGQTAPATIPDIADSWLLCALAERDAASATEALIAAGKGASP